METEASDGEGGSGEVGGGGATESPSEAAGANDVVTGGEASPGFSLLLGALAILGTYFALLFRER